MGLPGIVQRLALAEITVPSFLPAPRAVGFHALAHSVEAGVRTKSDADDVGDRGVRSSTVRGRPQRGERRPSTRSAKRRSLVPTTRYAKRGPATVKLYDGCHSLVSA